MSAQNMEAKGGIVETTAAYEGWAGEQLDFVAADLALKHARMAADKIAFLRATFYRWAEVWPELCPEAAAAPRVLAVGDLHIENFGTWRDIEGRLVWGVNDFDECASMPYTADLVRLATSALMAAGAGNVAMPAERICDTILDGYRNHLEEPRPFVLEEPFHWMRKLALGGQPDPRAFWSKLNELPDAGDASLRIRRRLAALFPEKGLKPRFVHRSAGLGSLGRPRYVALAKWHGSTVAREAKALLPSAWFWARNKKDRDPRYNELLARSIRCPDPYSREEGSWFYRRLAPESVKIDLGRLADTQVEERLLHAMGAETANVHGGRAKDRAAILADLDARPRGWLDRAAERMVAATEADWHDWQRAVSKRVTV